MAAVLSGMDRQLRGREREDQPPAAGVDGGQPEDVAEERLVGFGVGASDDDVRAAQP